MAFPVLLEYPNNPIRGLLLKNNVIICVAVCREPASSHASVDGDVSISHDLVGYMIEDRTGTIRDTFFLKKKDV